MPMLLAALLVGLAAPLLVPPRARRPGGPLVDGPTGVAGASGRASAGDGWLRRGRWAWGLLAGTGAAALVGGQLALPAGVVTGAVVTVVASRAEPDVVRREREETRRDLPHLVTLLAAALRSGVAVPDALALVADALPGAAAGRLVPLGARLRLGEEPGRIWAVLVADAELAPLGRALARSHRTGAPVVAAVERLAEELARRSRAAVEDRARAVGVRAAVPLGLCLLPSFLLLGIVPLAVSLATTIV